MSGSIWNPNGWINTASAAFISFLQAGVGAILRTLQDKAREQISVKDYGAAGDGVTNDAAAIEAAGIYAASVGGGIIFPAGKYYVNSTVNLSNKVSLTGVGKTASEIFFGASGKFSLVGTDVSPKGYLTISKLGLTNQGGGPVYVLDFLYVTRVTIIDCVVYGTGISLSAFTYCVIELCDLFSGVLFCTHPTVNLISDAIKIVRCQGSGFSLDIQNTADPAISGCSFLGGGAQIKIQRGAQPANLYMPVFISDTIVDSGSDEGILISGMCVHLMNSFVSNGRPNLKSGISLTDCVEGALVNVQVRFCGDNGLFMDNCRGLVISDSSFNDNKTNGVKINNCSDLRFVANQMSNAPTWFGGNYVQVKGITDTLSNCTAIAFIGNRCSGNSSIDVELPAAPNTNFLLGNSGIANVSSLNTYQSGTFLPTVIGGTTPGVGTYVTQQGAYTKIGNVVTLSATISISAHTGTGTLQLANLPFVAKNQAGLNQAVTLSFLNNLALTAGNIAQANILPNTTIIAVVQTPVAGGAVTNVPIDVAFDVTYSATYIANT